MGKPLSRLQTRWLHSSQAKCSRLRCLFTNTNKHSNLTQNNILLCPQRYPAHHAGRGNPERPASRRLEFWMRQSWRWSNMSNLPGANKSCFSSGPVNVSLMHASDASGGPADDAGTSRQPSTVALSLSEHPRSKSRIERPTQRKTTITDNHHHCINFGDISIQATRNDTTLKMCNRCRDHRD